MPNCLRAPAEVGFSQLDLFANTQLSHFQLRKPCGLHSQPAGAQAPRRPSTRRRGAVTLRKAAQPEATTATALSLSGQGIASWRNGFACTYVIAPWRQGC